MNEDAERRIEEARKQAQRQKDTAEFLQSLKPGDETLRRIVNPEAWAMRNKAQGAANRGDYPKTGCPHPFSFIQQYQDDDPSVKRRGLPVNLFECGQCGTLLWLVDPYGEVKADG